MCVEGLAVIPSPAPQPINRSVKSTKDLQISETYGIRAVRGGEVVAITDYTGADRTGFSTQCTVTLRMDSIQYYKDSQASITAIYAVVIIIISTIRNSVLFTFTGNILLIIASIKLLFIDTNSPNTYLMFGNSKIFFTTLFVVFLILLVFSIGISIFQHKYKITRTKKIEKHKVFKLISGYNYTVFPSLLIITTSILSFFIIANEIDTQFNYHLDFTFATFYLDVFFPFYFAFMLFKNFSNKYLLSCGPGLDSG